MFYTSTTNEKSFKRCFVAFYTWPTMSYPAVSRKPLEEVNYLLAYIDCALNHHPRPLPSESGHAYRGAAIVGPPEVQDFYHCLYKLYKENRDSENFREPVNALAMGVFNYYDVVKDPISIRTVLDRLVATEPYYTTVEQIEADVERIWSNAELFNGPQSAVAAKAQACRDSLRQLREDFEDDKIPPEADVVKAFDGVADTQNSDFKSAVERMLRVEYPNLLTPQYEVSVAEIRVRHLKRLQELKDRYL